MVELSRLEFLVCDWSGVISDDRKPVFEANQRMFEKRGIPRESMSEWLARSQMSVRETMRDRGVMDEPESLQEEYRMLYGEIMREGLAPTMYEDAPAFLHQAVGMELLTAVVSAHPLEHLVNEAKTYNLAPYIRRFVGDASDKKYELLGLVSNSGVLARHFAYVGDMASDIQAAKGAGMMAIAVTTGYHSRERLLKEEPDIIVNSLSELSDMLWRSAA